MPLANWPRLADWLIRWGFWNGVEEPNELLLLDAAGAEVQARLPGGPERFSGPWFERRAVFSTDGQRLAVLSTANVLRIWELPLRRPYGLIHSLAAVLPIALGLVLVGARLYNRLGRHTAAII